MKNKFFCVLLSMVVFFMFSGQFYAETEKKEEKKAQLYLILDEVVIPSKTAEYEKNAEKLLSVLKAKNDPGPWTIYKTDDNHYYWISPIKNYGEIDKRNEFGSKAYKGDMELKKIMKSMFSTVESTTAGFFYYSFKLSYIPENAKPDPEGENFVYWAYYYIKPGFSEEFYKIAKEWKEMNFKHKVPYGHNIWVGDFWHDLPVLVVSVTANSPMEFYAREQKIDKKLSEETAPLAKRTMEMVRKVEFKTGYKVKNLEYKPVKEKK